MSDQNSWRDEPAADLPPGGPAPEAPASQAAAAESAAAPMVVSPSGGGATSDDKLWTLLAYVFSPVIPFVILLMSDKKDRPFIKAHNWQALVAGIAAIVILIILSLIPVVGCISPIVALAYWILMVYWGLQSYNGKYVNIPIITDFVKKQGWA
jgi:uncharacterized membrane protein